MERRGRARGSFGFAPLVVELELATGPGIGSADGRGSNRSLHRMRAVCVGLPRGRDLYELGGESGRGGITVPRVWRLHAGMPHWRSADE